MAGDWIKMRSNLWDDPRVLSICDKTGQVEAPIIGALYWLWANADQHTEDGIMPGLTIAQIDRKAGVKGFSAALVQIGWLIELEAGVRIIRFEEHNGTSAKKRVSTAKRVADHRSRNPDVTPKALQKENTDDTEALARERERERERERVNSGAKAPDAKASKGASKTKVSSGKPQDEDPVKREIWALGKPMLAKQGIGSEEAGAFIGKIIRDYGQVTVAEAIRSVEHQSQLPMNLREWLMAACLRANGRRLTPVGGRADRVASFHAGLDSALDEPPFGDSHATDDDRTVDTSARRID